MFSDRPDVVEALRHTERLLTELLPSADNAALIHEQLTAERDHLRQIIAAALPEHEVAYRLGALLDESVVAGTIRLGGYERRAVAALLEGTGYKIVPADKPEPSAQAQPAGLDLDAMRRAIHELSWCKEDRMHAFAHGDDPEDDELRERFAAAYAEGEPE
jgi:hypothetical protein